MIDFTTSETFVVSVFMVERCDTRWTILLSKSNHDEDDCKDILGEDAHMCPSSNDDAFLSYNSDSNSDEDFDCNSQSSCGTMADCSSFNHLASTVHGIGEGVDMSAPCNHPWQELHPHSAPWQCATRGSGAPNSTCMGRSQSFVARQFSPTTWAEIYGRQPAKADAVRTGANTLPYYQAARSATHSEIYRCCLPWTKATSQGCRMLDNRGAQSKKRCKLFHDSKWTLDHSHYNPHPQNLPDQRPVLFFHVRKYHLQFSTSTRCGVRRYCDVLLRRQINMQKSCQRERHWQGVVYCGLLLMCANLGVTWDCAS